jgi:uncharacterized Ntn-hydrolase superfamily protein
MTWLSRTRAWALLLVAAGCCCRDSPPPARHPFLPPVQGHVAPPVHTFSIVAFDPDTGEVGVAVQSKFFGVGSVVPWAKAKVGAIATQASANITYGPEGLALLQSGKSAREVVQALTGADTNRVRRQLGVVDAQGRSASFTGERCHAWAGHYEGTNFCVQGNLLTGPEVTEAMAKAFSEARQAATGELADWLMSALQAGQAAGGDKRGQQSAALLVVRENAGYGRANDRYIDLRVEDHAEPIKELARLLEIHKKFYAAAHRRKPKAEYQSRPSHPSPRPSPR